MSTTRNSKCSTERTLLLATTIDNNGNSDNNDEEEEKETFESDDRRRLFHDVECYDLCDLDTDDFSAPLPKITNNVGRTHPHPHPSQRTTSKNEDTAATGNNDDDAVSTVGKLRNNLELNWLIQQSQANYLSSKTTAGYSNNNNNATTSSATITPEMTICSDPCLICRGNGVLLCRFCGGTGHIDMGTSAPGTMGDMLIKNNGGITGVECPVCNENGEEICEGCMGSGWIAHWRIASSAHNDTLFL